jgi:hypothetical protein
MNLDAIFMLTDMKGNSYDDVRPTRIVTEVPVYSGGDAWYHQTVTRGEGALGTAANTLIGVLIFLMMKKRVQFKKDNK